MNYKIGIFGSAVDESEAAQQKAAEVGSVLAKSECIIITGACSGMPYAVAIAGSKNGLPVWGFSPVSNLADHKKMYPEQDITIYQKLFYVPTNYEFVQNDQACKKYRNVSSTATCDAGIIIAGRWGTLNEFTNLFDMGKVIGVLTGTGGVADELSSLSTRISKQTKAKLIFDSSPQSLVEKIITELEMRNK